MTSLLIAEANDWILWICAGRLFQNLGAAAENDLVPKVAGMHPLGNSSPEHIAVWTLELGHMEKDCPNQNAF